MAAYHDIDGVPASCDEWLLNEVLRNEWDFDGVVVADCGSIAMLHSFHKATAGLGEAGKSALEAGLDIELPSNEC